MTYSARYLIALALLLAGCAPAAPGSTRERFACLGLVLSGGWCMTRDGRYLGPNPYVVAPPVAIAPTRCRQVDYDSWVCY